MNIVPLDGYRPRCSPRAAVMIKGGKSIYGATQCIPALEVWLPRILGEIGNAGKWGYLAFYRST